MISIAFSLDCSIICAFQAPTVHHPRAHSRVHAFTHSHIPIHRSVTMFDWLPVSTAIPAPGAAFSVVLGLVLCHRNVTSIHWCLDVIGSLRVSTATRASISSPVSIVGVSWSIVIRPTGAEMEASRIIWSRT